MSGGLDSFKSQVEHDQDDQYERGEIDAMKEIDYSEIGDQICEFHEIVQQHLAADINEKNQDYLMRTQVEVAGEMVDMSSFFDAELYDLSGFTGAEELDFSEIGGRVRLVKYFLQQVMESYPEIFPDECKGFIDMNKTDFTVTEIIALHAFQARRQLSGKSNADAIVGPLTLQDLIHASGVLKDDVEKKPFVPGSIFEQRREEQFGGQEKPSVLTVSSLDEKYNRSQIAAIADNNPNAKVVLGTYSLLVEVKPNQWQFVDLSDALDDAQPEKTADAPVERGNDGLLDETKASLESVIEQSDSTEFIDENLFNRYVDTMQEVCDEFQTTHQELGGRLEERGYSLEIVSHMPGSRAVSNPERLLIVTSQDGTSKRNFGLINVHTYLDGRGEFDRKAFSATLGGLVAKNKQELLLQEKHESYKQLVREHIRGMEFAFNEIFGTDESFDQTQHAEARYRAYFDEFENKKLKIENQSSYTQFGLQKETDKPQVWFELDDDVDWNNADYNKGLYVDIDTLLAGVGLDSLLDGDDVELSKLRSNMAQQLRSKIDTILDQKYSQES